MRTLPPPSLVLGLTVSVMLHIACLAVAGFGGYPTAGNFNQPPAANQLQAKLVPLFEDSPLPLAAISEKKLDTPGRVPSGDSGAIESQPAKTPGYQVDNPVITLSVDDYFPPSRLDKIPKLIGSVDASVDFQGMTDVVGDAEVMVLISSKGDVDDVLIMQASLPNFLVDKVVANFKKAKYEPGVLGSHAVRSRLRLRLQPPTSDELLGNPSSARERAWH